MSWLSGLHRDVRFDESLSDGMPIEWEQEEAFRQWMVCQASDDLFFYILLSRYPTGHIPYLNIM